MAQLWPGQGGPSIDYISGPPDAAWNGAWPRSLCILGSTGSIGRSALAVVASHPQAFRIVGLACARQIERLAEQARELGWQDIQVADSADNDALLRALQ